MCWLCCREALSTWLVQNYALFRCLCCVSSASLPMYHTSVALNCHCVLLQTLSFVCLVATIVALVGSVQQMAVASYCFFC